MPEVTLRIGPKSYAVACGPGEEDKVRRLGAMIAERYDRLGNARAPLEAHNLVFAALFMADELSDLAARLAEAEHSVRKAQAASDRAAGARGELEREMETLRKAEMRAREDAKALRHELAELHEAQRHQHDLFGSEIDETALAMVLERLADQAESAAAALEAAHLEVPRDTA
ncbi:MAG: cell division protein ZapA [Erythrobacter sp.]|jgi:cell division protein ZapA|nr:cell division protein ZapA [Erythrobacter sp.]